MKLKKIPWLPVSALLFYLTALFLWKLSIIPSPVGIVVFLENLYKNYGLIGLFIASFLEGIVYLGLYFPGSFIIALAVIISDGSLESLLIISIVVAFALVITSIINYFFGRIIKSSKKSTGKIASRGLFLSMLHPNFLAFYFFNAGIRNQNPLKIILVPLVMIPYGFILAIIFSALRGPVRSAIENPYVMITLILLWLAFAFIFNCRKQTN